MTVRKYTPEEKARLTAGLSQEAWELTTREFERMARRAFATVPIMSQAAALHGLLCDNQELKDALDTIEYACKRERRPPYEQLTEDLGLYKRELEQSSPSEDQTDSADTSEVGLLKDKLAAAQDQIERLREKVVTQTTRAGLLEAKLATMRAAQEKPDGNS